MFDSLIPGMTYLIEYKNAEVVHQGTFVRYVDAHCAEFHDVACLYNAFGSRSHHDILFFYSMIPRIYTPVTHIRY
jgi:hypothetical protein